MRMQSHNTQGLTPPRRRGSILVLVLLLLALMTLFVAWWSYSARLEAVASRNVGRAVQARMAIASSIPAAAHMLAAPVGRAAGFIPPYTPRDTKSPETDDLTSRSSRLLKIQARDLGGLININAIRPPAEKAVPTPTASDFFAPAAGETAWSLPRREPVDALALAQAAASVSPVQSDLTQMPAEILETLVADQLGFTGKRTAQARKIVAALLALRDQRLAAAREDDAAPAPTPLPAAVVQSTAAATPAPTATPAPVTPYMQWQRDSAKRVMGRLSTGAAPAGVSRATSDASKGKAKTKAGEIEPTTGGGLPLARLRDLVDADILDDEALEALQPFLTVYSTSLDVWTDPLGLAHVRLPLNRASASDIAKVLRCAYPDAREADCLQFAANIVDRRDPDSIPTLLHAAESAEPILGYEPGPVISEVCPDVITFESDGDNGEYFEIYNPLDTPFELRGWRADWGSGSVLLNLTLPPRGFVIVTDDIKNENDSTPEDGSPGMGSFYDVFRILPAGGLRQLVERTGMDIPNDSGRIQLYDNMGNLIDCLTWKNGEFKGTNLGFHRLSPFDHAGRSAVATPFETQLGPPETAYETACWTVLQEYMDTPFQSVAELLAVPAGAVAEDAGVQWYFPTLSLSDNTHFDLRLLDLFVPGDSRHALQNGDDLIVEEQLPAWRPGAAWPGQPADAAALLAAASPEALAERHDLWNDLLSKTEPVAFGKINVNTAPLEIVRALPGLTPALAQAVVDARAGDGTTTATAPAFRTIADFAASDAVWSGVDPADRMARLIALCPLLTVNSSTWELTATHWIGKAAEASPLAARGIVRVRPAGVSVIDWNYYRPGLAESAPPAYQTGNDAEAQKNDAITPWDRAVRHGRDKRAAK